MTNPSALSSAQLTKLGLANARQSLTGHRWDYAPMPHLLDMRHRYGGKWGHEDRYECNGGPWPMPTLTIQHDDVVVHLSQTNDDQINLRMQTNGRARLGGCIISHGKPGRLEFWKKPGDDAALEDRLLALAHKFIPGALRLSGHSYAGPLSNTYDLEKATV